MYAKVFNLKFVKPTDAKVASSYFAENLAKFIRPCNMQSISISLGPCGSLTVTAKFDSGSDLKMFESKSNAVDIQAHQDHNRMHRNRSLADQSKSNSKSNRNLSDRIEIEIGIMLSRNLILL